MASTVGKRPDEVVPVTYTIPRAPMATPVPASLSPPPRYVEETSDEPSALRLASSASAVAPAVAA
jgi:hypothetical protein